MFAARVKWAGAAGLALSLFFILPVSADIYRYVDKDGVWHFTNVRNDAQYKLYIKTIRKTPSTFIKEYEGIILQASRRFEVEASHRTLTIRQFLTREHRA
jgi:soluble lytic murein transglycosylase